MKTARFKLESNIINHVYMDNGNTVHFDYHVDIDNGSVRLDMFTVNQKNLVVFLLHQTKAETSIEALESMLKYVSTAKEEAEKFPYSATWRKTAEKENHISYFWEEDEEHVRSKFFYNKDRKDYILISIELRPSS